VRDPRRFSPACPICLAAARRRDVDDLAVASAVFLIVELNTPFGGLLQFLAIPTPLLGQSVGLDRGAGKRAIASPASWQPSTRLPAMPTQSELACSAERPAKAP
jgi:hypothetical protein